MIFRDRLALIGIDQNRPILLGIDKNYSGESRIALDSLGWLRIGFPRGQKWTLFFPQAPGN